MADKTPYEIALKRIGEAARTHATELDLSGLGSKPLSVFLSYASEDKSLVLNLYDSLKSNDWIDPWLDKSKILPGENWERKIELALEKADVIVICLSNQSVSKEGFLQKEINYAYNIASEKLEDTIFLIPLRLDDCPVPRRLRTIHWVDFFGSEKQKEYSNLLSSLYLRYKQKVKMGTEDLDFNLSRNQLVHLPTEIGSLIDLISLDLSYNKLTALPTSIQNIKNLRELRLEGNNLPIPLEVFEKIKEPQVILDYYFSHLKKPLNECKVLVIGQGSVGKTSIVKQLVTGKFNSDEIKTEGIAITQWQVDNNQVGVVD